MAKSILGGGNLILDLVKRIDTYPAEQTLALIKAETTGTGGAPYNVLRNLAVLGCQLLLRCVGRVGDDFAGETILNDLSVQGVDIASVVRMQQTPTSYTLVMTVEGSGRRTFFHQPGANALHGEEDYDFSGLKGSHLHLGYLLLLPGLDQPDPEFGTKAAKVLARAKQAGLTTSIDLVSSAVDRFQEVVGPALAHTDLAFMNEYELALCAGVSPPKAVELDWIEAAASQLSFGGDLALHWAEGAALIRKNEEPLWQGSVQVPQEEIRSVVGAGDAFASGFLLGYTRGDPHRESMQLGVCCAASCLYGYGCTDSILPENDCLRLAQQYGYRGS